MIKRISILVRRAQDEREAFSRHWRGTHGGLVAQLPDVGRYVQNHVVEEFHTAQSAIPGYDVDGFVELYFADDAARRRAFAGSASEPIWADEVNFLGHSTAYVIEGDRYPASAMTEAKLIVVADAGAEGIEWLAQRLEAIPGEPDIERNDVVEVVARAAMARGPQPASAFFSLRFSDVQATQNAGLELTATEVGVRGIRRLSIVRVREMRII